MLDLRTSIGMERTMWPDQRLDYEFGSLHAEMREMRTEMREGFRDLRSEMAAMRREMHMTMLGMLGTMSATLVAVVAHAF